MMAIQKTHTCDFDKCNKRTDYQGPLNDIGWAEKDSKHYCPAHKHERIVAAAYYEVSIYGIGLPGESILDWPKIIQDLIQTRFPKQQVSVEMTNEEPL